MHIDACTQYDPENRSVAYIPPVSRMIRCKTEFSPSSQRRGTDVAILRLLVGVGKRNERIAITVNRLAASMTGGRPTDGVNRI